MWTYDKKLQYPVNIKNPDPKMAQIIISQLGGPDGEIGASMRYLNQRYSCPYGKVTGILTDVGTEELAHMEIVAAILYQLTQGLCEEEIKSSGFDTYFVDQSTDISLPYPLKRTSSSGSLTWVIRRGPPVCCYSREKQHGCDNGMRPGRHTLILRVSPLFNRMTDFSSDFNSSIECFLLVFPLDKKCRRV